MTGFRKLMTGAVAVAVFGLMATGCTEPAGDTKTADTTAGAAASTNAGNEDLSRQFMDEVLVKGNMAFADEHTATDFVDHTPAPGQEPGLEGFKKAVTMWREAMPDLNITIHEVVSEGELVAIHSTQTGTFAKPLFGPGTEGKRIEVAGVDLVRIKDGKMVEHWGYAQEGKMMEQLGLIPPMDAPPAGGTPGATPPAGDTTGGAAKDTAK